MRTAVAILVISFAAACSTASAAPIINSCPVNAPVTSSLAFVCSGQVFDFGHDLAGNAIDPLPLGGSLTLKSVLFIDFLQPEWDLRFGFNTPSAGTTQLQFSTIGPPCNCLNGPGLLGLGMNLSPLGMPGFNIPNESGSNFTITETVTSLAGPPTTYTITNGGNVSGWLAFGTDTHHLFVSTLINDRAGDLTGFNVSFDAPEPGTWTLLTAGLALFTFRRRRK